MKTLAFFNNKGGVGVPVLAIDLDPQSNLSSMFLTEQRLAELWNERKTVMAAVQPLVARSGDIAPAHTETMSEKLHLVTGDLGLSRFEDLLSENWGKCLNGEEGAFRVISSFHRIMREAAARTGAQLVLIDQGPNLGALNRAALLAAQHLVLPLAPDLFSIQGMENLGPTLREWRAGWRKRIEEIKGSDLDLPGGEMRPAGYVVMSFGVRDKRPVQAYDDRLNRIPSTYRRAVLNEDPANSPDVDHDPYRLAALKHYRSLMPMAMAAHKPMFSLKSADGARGAHLEAVRACYDDFLSLVRRIADVIGFAVP